MKTLNEILAILKAPKPRLYKTIRRLSLWDDGKTMRELMPILDVNTVSDFTNIVHRFKLKYKKVWSYASARRDLIIKLRKQGYKIQDLVGMFNLTDKSIYNILASRKRRRKK